MKKSVAAIVTFSIIVVVLIIGGVPSFETVWSFPGNFELFKNFSKNHLQKRSFLRYQKQISVKIEARKKNYLR